MECTRAVGNKNTRLLLVGGCAAVTLILIVSLATGIPLSSNATKSADQVAIAALESTPVIDGHNDFPWLLWKRVNNQINGLDLTQDLRVTWKDKGEVPPMTDIPRLREGRVGAQFWAAYVPCSTQYKDAVMLTLQQIDVIHRFVQANLHTFSFARSAQDIEDCMKSDKIASLIGVEGGQSLDSSLAVLRMYYALGVRYMTLTHSCNTPWADSSPVDVSTDHSSNPNNFTAQYPGVGFSQFGKVVMKEMNRLGMLVDISHVSADVMRTVLNESAAPVIFSHSSVSSYCTHHRNVPDDVLDMVPANGGLVMINFYNEYVTCDKAANLSDVADHIDYVKDRIGADFVGLGSDFDGVDIVPQGLSDVSTFPALFKEMAGRGWREEELEKLSGRNLLRVLRGAEQIRDEQTALPPYEDILPEAEIPDGANICRG